MLLVDVNVLIYAIDSGSRHHAAAREWLLSALRGAETVGFAWVVLLAFLRLTTRPALTANPLTSADAIAIVERWLTLPGTVVVEPTARHLAVLDGLLAAVGTAGNLVTDAHLAALAVEHNAGIVSFDRDFDRFPGVRWQLPNP